MEILRSSELQNLSSCCFVSCVTQFQQRDEIALFARLHRRKCILLWFSLADLGGGVMFCFVGDSETNLPDNPQAALAKVNLSIIRDWKCDTSPQHDNSTCVNSETSPRETLANFNFSWPCLNHEFLFLIHLYKSLCLYVNFV